MTPLVELVARHKSGQHAGIYSLCSAHPLVIEAALYEARASDTPLLIEATSNQVNQFGGYTGHDAGGLSRLRAWHRRSRRLPGRARLARRRSPRSQRLAAGAAASRDGPRRRAGRRSSSRPGSASFISTARCRAPTIHRRCRKPTVASRAARLCAAAERAWQRAGGEAPVYVIGTEVPTPGGAGEDLLTLTVTTPEAAQATIEAHRGRLRSGRSRRRLAAR